MTQHTQETVHFTTISGKTLEVDFDGGEVTSDAGLLFVREVDHRAGILRRAAAALQDRRHPSYVQHSLESLVRQRVFQILAGYEDSNDCTTLRHDPVLKMVCHKRPLSDAPLASQPTMSRFENTPSPRALYRLGQALVDLFVASYDTPPTALILDIDDTADETHGAQQLSCFNAFHDGYCYLPIHVYEGQSGKLLTSLLRPGRRPTGTEIVALLKRLVHRLRTAWPQVGILLRGDGHYSAPEVHDWCEAHDVHFVVGQSGNAALYAHAAPLMARAAALYTLQAHPVTLFGECWYQAKSWTHPRRVIVKAEYNAKGANTRFIVTSFQHSTPRALYQTVYCGRGKMELYIKEHKTHLASDRTSCHSFAANQFRLFLHSLAYVLLHTLRHRHLAGTDLARAQFDTIRLKLLKIGGRVRELVTKVKIHLPSSYPWQAEFLTIWRSCCTSGSP